MTPGPWELEVDTTSTGPMGTVFGPDGYRISNPYILLDDARLIAAAPDLLEALTNMVSLATPHFSDALQLPALEMARAAIRKATNAN